jgi:3-hydroxyisobutyrate dehydrogenase-like beta-hydroxyacid dehydrogenase
MSEKQRVTVVGLGLMGAAIARTLVAAGHDVTVWNRTPAKAGPLADAGATVAPDLPTALAASPVSLWCLLDYRVTADLIADEATTRALAGRTVVPSATGGPDDVALVARALEPLGAPLLDAKIMFFPAQAGAPDAELLLSGSREAFAAHEGLLRDVAGACRYLGTDVAAASVLYTAVWAYDFAARFAYMEAAALVEASGLALDDFRASAALRTAQLAGQNRELSDRFAAGDFDGDQATVDIYAEGMDPMLRAFGAAGVRPRLLEGVAAYAEAAQRAGHGLRDVSVVFDLLRRRLL